MTRLASRPVLVLIASAIVAAGCQPPRTSSSGLTFPSGAGGSGSLSGTVVAYGTNTPVSGATVRLGNVFTVTNAAGQYTLNSIADSGAGVLSVILPGYIPRGAAFNLASGKTGADVNIIRDTAPFSLDFYRQIARDGAESATFLPTNRWTVSPSFYFQRLTVDTVTPVPDDIIASIQANFATSVPEMTGGKFHVAASVVGDTTMPTTDGWVIVTFYTVTPSGSLGAATVGGNSGTMNLLYDPTLVSGPLTNPYNCASIPLQVADNLIVNTMGFWHTLNTLVDEFSGPGCPGVGRPANFLYHTTLMYSRPQGNLDQDIDPLSSAQIIVPSRAARRMVVYDPARIVRRR